jgi:dephospho-CoA kinase
MAATKPVICVVGGIGSGKSSVAAAFVRRGGRLIAGDLLGHEALRQPNIRERIVKRFGMSVVNDLGEIDRRQLGRIVFGDAGQLRALESLVFPWIERRIGEEIAIAQTDPGVAFIVVDAAILLEAGWNRCCDRLLFVDAPREARLKRLTEQRGWNEKEVLARESAQMDLDDKRRLADHVIANNGAPGDLDQQVAALLREWRIQKP